MSLFFKPKFKSNTEYFDDLFKGKPDREFCCCLYNGRSILVKKLGKSKSQPDAIVCRCQTGLHEFAAGEYIMLRLHGTAQKFEKGFKVLSLKSEETNSSNEYYFFAGEIVSGPNKDENSERKSYKVKFDDDDSVKDIHEEFIVPPKDFWTRESEYFHAESKKADEQKSEKESQNESESESESEDEKKSKKEKHKHHKHKKHHKYNKHHHDYEQPNIIILPIFIPYQHPMQMQMQTQFPYFYNQQSYN